MKQKIFIISFFLVAVKHKDSFVSKDNGLDEGQQNIVII